MELLHCVASVRLRSHNGRYLTAADDEESVKHKSNGASRAAAWAVEPVDDSPGFFRFRSCVGRLLTASDSRFLLGATGFKVLQTTRSNNNTSVEWQPLRDETSGVPRVRLRSRRGTFLRANGGKIPPYRGSVTHDDPVLAHGWVLWEVDTLEPHPLVSPPRSIKAASPSAVSSLLEWDSPLSETTSSSEKSFPDQPESWKRVTYAESLMRSETPEVEAEAGMGRTIRYQVVDDDGEVDSRYPGGSFLFRGTSVQKLTRRIEDHSGIPDVILCVQDATRFNKLHKIRLGLPPGRATMTVFAVRSSSPAVRSFEI